MMNDFAKNHHHKKQMNVFLLQKHLYIKITNFTVMLFDTSENGIPQHTTEFHS